jgi:hypothetical protein
LGAARRRDVNPRRCLNALVLAACATTPAQSPGIAEYPTTLSSPASHPGNFIRRQKLVVEYQRNRRGFEAVLQKKDDEITLVGLTPFGTKAFVLTQTGVEVHFTTYFAQAVQFPPRYMLNDVSRTYFGGIGDRALSDGEHQADRDGERIWERWKDGRLMERRFTRVAADPPGQIVISYVGGMEGSRSPALVEFDNGWLGYHLSVSTLSEEAL